MEFNNGRLEDRSITCPECGSGADGFKSKTADRPSDGDITICVYCKNIAKYTENTTKIVSLSKNEIDDLKKDVEFWKQIQQYSLIIDVEYLRRN